MKVHCYRSDDWGGGFYRFGFSLWRFSMDCRWCIWAPVTVIRYEVEEPKA